jgi:glycosyltransferase involved in cell wall biosynthesis
MYPKVSIVIPVYNEEKYLNKCLDSVINQTLRNIEIICVNDGSTDSSLEILKEYERSDERMKILNQRNLGAGIGRNKGLEVAQGRYIGFIDADDIFVENNALKVMFCAGEEYGCDMVSANIKRVTNNSLGDLYYMNNVDTERIISPAVYGIPWYFCKSIFRREFLVENDISFPNYMRGEDPVFLAKVLAKVDRIINIPINYYGYRHIPDESKLNSNIIDYFQHFIDVFKILDNSKFYNANQEYYGEFRKFIKYFVHESYRKTILQNYKDDFILFKFIQSNFDLR